MCQMCGFKLNLCFIKQAHMIMLFLVCSFYIIIYLFYFLEVAFSFDF